MLTRETLDAMTPQERAETMKRLAMAHYGTGWLAQLRADMDIGKTTAYRWLNEGPPFAVLYALDAWTRDLTADQKQLLWAARTAQAALAKALSA